MHQLPSTSPRASRSFLSPSPCNPVLPISDQQPLQKAGPDNKQYCLYRLPQLKDSHSSQGGIRRAYTFSDVRGLCYWETQDVFCKRPLSQGGENEAIEENVPNKQTRQIPALFEVEIGNLAKKEFKVVIEKIIKELRERMDAQSKELIFFFIKD